MKGPELLNKYVGETEHKIREVFKKAREKASEDVPVVIFFDEMDSLFRMRGSGISSDMEATVVAQFLSEIDGVESLKNVIVIGASNRQDLIDPAVLRPGRLDLKVKVQRPDAEAAKEIFTKYLTAGSALPRRGAGEVRQRPGEDRRGHDRRAIETHVPHRRREQVPRGDLRQGRARDLLLQGLRERRHDREHRGARQEGAVKRTIDQHDERGIKLDDLIEAVNEEFKENEDLPNTTNPDDWARISGRKGERIINVRTLMTGISRKERSIENITSGQYL